jgi:hypothetical protein
MNSRMKLLSPTLRQLNGAVREEVAAVADGLDDALKYAQVARGTVQFALKG